MSITIIIIKKYQQPSGSLLGILFQHVATHPDPGDELGHVAAHQPGVGGRGRVVLVCSGQPVHHDDVGSGLTLVQGRHQLGHPALKHSRYLQKTHTHTDSVTHTCFSRRFLCFSTLYPSQLMCGLIFLAIVLILCYGTKPMCDISLNFVA